MNDSAPVYYERAVAEILGFSRDEFRHVRSEVLKKKTEWRQDGRDVVLTEPGLQKILAHLKAVLSGRDNLDFSPALVNPPSLSSNGAAEKKEDGAIAETTGARPELLTLTVARVYPNYRLLQATTPAGELVDVRVRNNQNFVPRMTLKARPSAGGKYEMEGRCPRFRGRY